MSFSSYSSFTESGVGWLGSVPDHWQISTIKRVVETPVTDGPHETPAFLDEGIPFVSAEAVSTGVIDFEKIRGFISESDHRRYSQKYKPRRNDIYMVKSGATTGISAIVETDLDFNIWSPLAVIRCGASVLPRFALNFVRSKNFQEAVQLGWNFGTQQNIGMGVIENFAIAVPPLEEQKKIAEFLDFETAKIAALIKEQEHLLALKREQIACLALETFSDLTVNHVRLRHVVEKLCRPVELDSATTYVPLGLFNKGRGLFHKDETLGCDMGDSDFFLIKEGDMIFSGQFAWEGAVAMAGLDEDGCVVSHRYPVVRGLDGVALTEYIFALFLTSHGTFLMQENSRGAAGRNRPLNIDSLLRETIPLPSIEAQKKIKVAVDSLKVLRGKVNEQKRLLLERQSSIVSLAVTGKIDVRGFVAPPVQ